VRKQKNLKHKTRLKKQPQNRGAATLPRLIRTIDPQKYQKYKCKSSAYYMSHGQQLKPEVSDLPHIQQRICAVELRLSRRQHPSGAELGNSLQACLFETF
jgi:hypothetical protein